MSVTDQMLAMVIKSYLNPTTTGEKSYQTLGGVQKRLDYYSGTVDLEDPKEVDKLILRIDTARINGAFGDEPEIHDHVANYIGTLAQGKKRKSQVLTDRKELYSLTNPSSINKILKTSMISTTDASYDPVVAIENQIVNLSMARDRLADNDALSTALDGRYNNAIGMFDNALKEHGTDGLTEEEMERIMNDTYATQKIADVNFVNLQRQYEWAREFETPSLQEKQLLGILEEHHSAIKNWDDEASLMDYQYQWLQTVDPSMLGEEMPDLARAEEQQLSREMYRQSDLFPSHSQQYKAVYDTYQKLRKDNPDSMQLANWDEIMDTTIHQQLYNFVPLDDPRSRLHSNLKNTTFDPGKYNSKGENEIVYSMLERGKINFTKSITDELGNVWKSEGETLQGLGQPSPDTWKIKSIDRDDNGTLNRIVLTIPNYNKTMGTTRLQGLAPGATVQAPTETSVFLNADDFVIEDDPNNPHKGFTNTTFGAAKYNIYTGKFHY